MFSWRSVTARGNKQAGTWKVAFSVLGNLSETSSGDLCSAAVKKQNSVLCTLISCVKVWWATRPDRCTSTPPFMLSVVITAIQQASDGANSSPHLSVEMCRLSKQRSWTLMNPDVKVWLGPSASVWKGRGSVGTDCRAASRFWIFTSCCVWKVFVWSPPWPSSPRGPSHHLQSPSYLLPNNWGCDRLIPVDIDPFYYNW